MERECSVSRTVMDTECGWGGIGQEHDRNSRGAQVERGWNVSAVTAR